jgi:helix-turn-helix protein
METCVKFAPHLTEFINLHINILNEKEVRICMMIYAGFPPKIMGKLLCSSKQNITSLRSRLYLKLFGKEGSSTDFDHKIRSI